MHLSGPAHRLIARDAARLVRENSTVNSDARQKALQGSATTKENKKSASGFKLKFPPE
jgi:hypothetical protein